MYSGDSFSFFCMCLCKSLRTFLTPFFHHLSVLCCFLLPPLFVCMTDCPSVRPSVIEFIFVFLFLSIYLPTYLPTYLPIYLPTYHLPTYLSIYLSIYLSCLSAYLSIYLFIYLSFKRGLLHITRQKVKYRHNATAILHYATIGVR